MKSSSQLLVLGMLWPLSAAAASDGAASTSPLPPDTSQWKCESCPFPQGVSGTVDVGAGSVSNKSAKFGEYTGLNKKGAFFVGDGDASYRGADGVYWNANASNLGLRSRSLDAEGGQQGKYKLFLKYDELPHFISDTAQTPYLGTGGNSLTLPPGFAAPTTALMPLAGTLHGVDLDTQRKRLGIGGSWMPIRDWEYSVNFRHETKEGTKRTAGPFFVNSAQLVEPVDYETNQIDASASYTGNKWQAKVAYYGSTFRNSNDFLTWQNPFTLLPGNPTAGQLALPPDNQFHQILASAGYQFNDRTRAVADIAYGRMTQNDAFLAPTLNPALVAPALPRTTLDATAKTINGNLKLTSSVTDLLRLNAVYSHNERDNQTPQSAYSWVSTDMFLATPRTNLPYSFRQDKVKLSGEYRVFATTKASVGYDFDSNTRTFQEVDTTREKTIWAAVTSRAVENLDVTLKLSHGERNNSGFHTVPVITPPENPLLRRYNLADRKRDSAALRGDFAATENINIGFGASASRDDYSNSTIGLTRGSEYSVNGDVAVRVSEKTTLHFFANRDRIESTQAGSQAFATPDWIGENTDTITFVGVGLRQAVIEKKLDVGADYGLLRAQSDISVNAGTSNPAFPTISTSIDTVKLYAIYRVKDNVSLNASFWHESYDSKNWMLNGVTPNTIPNVLTLGELPPGYSVNVVRVSVRYKF
jgi:MtrB/PioB family decaheme-associated outer membrane protein